MTKLHLISYIVYGPNETAVHGDIATNALITGLSESRVGRRNFRVEETLTPTTPDELCNELENLASAQERPFVTVIDGHGGGETPYRWHLSGFSGTTRNAYAREIANRGVRFETDILFVIACNSWLALKHWRTIVGEKCDIVLSRVQVTDADFTRFFACFMLAAMGEPGRTRIDPSTRRTIWNRAIEAYEILEVGNRTDGWYKHERFEVDHGTH